MATLNSLLFLFSTLAPNVEHSGNNFVTQAPSRWNEGTISSRYGQNVPVLTQMNCNIGEYLDCKSHCQKNCTNYEKDIPCPDVCVLGCVCIDPFIRGDDGSCIMSYECPVTPDTLDSTDIAEEFEDIQCNDDEESSSFAHCQRNCSNIDQVIICPGEGPRGCVCKSPLIKGPEGTCIMPNTCPTNLRNQQAPMLTQTTCDTAEELRCNSHCEKNCNNYDKDIPCPDICVLGCVCTEPFIRGPDGTCIMHYECPVTSDTPVRTEISEEHLDIECHPDEEVSYYPHCQRNCTNLGQIILCPGKAAPGCVCQSPMIRGPEGTCITVEQCPVILRTTPDEDDPRFTCPPHEDVSCFVHCQPNCTNYDKHIPCPMYCVQGCVCTPPLIRGPDGSCIMPEQCNALKRPLLKKQCLDSEECGENDDDVPENDNDVLSRSFQGPFDNWRSCNDKNEVYKICSSQCPDDCENYNDTRRACKLICLPLPKCECKPGFVRGPNGDCIEPKQCPHVEYNWRSCNDKNEVYKICSSQCPDDCENYNDTRRACKLICLPLPKCECKPGFVRGPNGDCIEPKQCPHVESSDIFCPENEKFRLCGPSCQKNCENYDKDLPCEAVCRSGCFCKKPMIRGPNGKCIYKEECPAKLTAPSLLQTSEEICPENEEYKECGTACQKTCRNYERNVPCEFKCEPGCFCKEQMVRGFDGKCIRKEDCPAKANESRQPRKNFNMRFLPDFPKITCKENEEFSLCAQLCPDDCSNYKEDRLCKRICVPGCRCIEGYVKGKEGTCIKKEKCEEISTVPTVTTEKPSDDCSDLEEYKECGCEVDCHNYNATDRICEDSNCRKGCFCKEGLVRSSDGKCISSTECPAPNNAFWSMKTLRRRVHF